MPREEFKRATLQEAQQAVERWKRDHPGVTITKEFPPVEFLFGGMHFLSKERGPGELIAVMIVVDYEDPNSGPARPTSDRPKS